MGRRKGKITDSCIKEGVKIGKLLLVENTTPSKIQTQDLWSCLCDCGKSVEISRRNLLHYNTKSCGCLRMDVVTKHGMYQDTTYRSWQSLLDRCRNQNRRSYKNYGGRGITVCDRWNPEKGGSFENFLEDMGEKPNKKFSIERINVNGNYEPNNCCWASAKVQSYNKTNTVIIEYKGRKYNVGEFSKLTGLTKKQITTRLSKGMSCDEIVNSHFGEALSYQGSDQYKVINHKGVNFNVHTSGKIDILNSTFKVSYEKPRGVKTLVVVNQSGERLFRVRVSILIAIAFIKEDIAENRKYRVWYKTLDRYNVTAYTIEVISSSLYVYRSRYE